MSDKVIPFDKLSDTSEALRTAGKKIVATNGCFDLLHVGHVRYLEAARQQGDILVVGLNDDESVRELKGAGRPINRASDRAELLSALECVDLVTIFPETRATRFIQMVQPDVYVKGGDYTLGTLNAEEREVLEKIGSRMEIVSFVEGYSTSRLLAELCRPK